ncbi:MAG: amidase, partial [Chloroflexi bacterium]|nr:amidase [Chloroflexota bacterium]
VVTLVADDALAGAADADAAQARGDELGPLHGLPAGIKDLVATAGIRTTMGSPIYADNVPSADAEIVSRMKSAGAVVLGKTNTPEFGAGSQTFNQVFGATLNAYDTSRTCGGSSGGSGVGLACGMFPTTVGTDLGGSLRNPAAWSNVVGLRPSPGRVPASGPLPWTSMSTAGPMGRTVGDVALQLSVQAGPDPLVPSSLQEDPAYFAGSLDRDFAGTRIAWSRDLGGRPIEPVQTQVLDAQRHVFEDLGCIVEDAEPDLSEASSVFQVLRAFSFAHGQESHLRDHRDLLKDTVIWNAEEGLELRALDVAKAEETRTELFGRMIAFFDQYDYLALPVTSVPPFSVDIPYPTVVNGVEMETYIDWMWPCMDITAIACPAISVPSGFTPDGLPVGLQLVSAPRTDFALLQLAHAFEGATQFWKQRPGVVS